MSAAMYAFQRRMRAAHALEGYRPLYGHVLLALATYADPSGVAAPSRAVLATVTGHHADRVAEALSWAQRRGLVRKIGGGYRGRAAEYVICPERGDQGTPQSGEKGGTKRATKGGPVDPPNKLVRGPSPPKGSTAPPWEPDEDPDPDPWPTASATLGATP